MITLHSNNVFFWLENALKLNFVTNWKFEPSTTITNKHTDLEQVKKLYMDLSRHALRSIQDTGQTHCHEPGYEAILTPDWLHMQFQNGRWSVYRPCIQHNFCLNFFCLLFIINFLHAIFCLLFIQELEVTVDEYLNFGWMKYLRISLQTKIVAKLRGLHGT